MIRLAMLTAGLSLVLSPALLRADVWDQATDSDNSCGAISDNELIHGSDQVHDLGVLAGAAVDEDNFTLTSRAYSSYEAVIDGLTGDLNNGGNPDFDFTRTDVNCTNVQSFLPTGLDGFSRSVRWETGGSTFLGGIRVANPACGSACTAADQYRLAFHDTTYTVARFNNSATQVTVLIVQNSTAQAAHITSWFLDPAGSLLANVGATISARGTYVLNTSSVAALQGQGGSIMISNDAPYGMLSGKAVALESATGFTFDTAMVSRPR